MFCIGRKRKLLCAWSEPFFVHKVIPEGRWYFLVKRFQFRFEHLKISNNDRTDWKVDQKVECKKVIFGLSTEDPLKLFEYDNKDSFAGKEIVSDVPFTVFSWNFASSVDHLRLPGQLRSRQHSKHRRLILSATLRNCKVFLSLWTIFLLRCSFGSCYGTGWSTATVESS